MFGKIAKYLIATAALIMTIINANCQTLSQIEHGRYIWADGRGKTIKEAEKAGLEGILSQISLRVTSDFQSTEHEKLAGGDAVSETEVNQIVSSYSAATLTNLRRMPIVDEPGNYVFRFYISESELDRIFTSRIEKAIGLIEDSEEALDNLQIDDALRNLYWSFALVGSVRYPNEAKYNGELISTYVPKKIREILNGLDMWAEQVSGSNCDFDLFVSYKGSPVRSLEYQYFDGQDYSGIYQVRNGRGILEMRPPVVAKSVDVTVEYMFENYNIDKEIEDVLAVHRAVAFREAKIPVSLKGRVKRAEVKKHDAVKDEVNETNEVRAVFNIDDSDVYTGKIESIAETIANATSYSNIQPYFTDSAWGEFNTIKNYGKMKLQPNYKLTCTDSGVDGEVVCRGLGCDFYFSKGKTFREEITFFFDPDGKINHVALGLGSSLEAEILSKTTWPESARKTIISFLEGYRTAYAMKDLDYMETVLDDNAVIIVGTKVASAPHLNDASLVNNDCIVKTRKTKRQFIESLARSFKSKEYINLHFEKCEIIRLDSNSERYGIQIKQDYYSSTYGDSGYLYLLVDLTKPKEPVIHVRAWQEAPDPEFGLIGPGTF